MRKNLIPIIFTIIFSGCLTASKENRVCYQNHCFAVELAITDQEKIKGLQDRTHLDKDKGMLFALDAGMPQKFWMKKTLIPLDMIWLDYDGRIIYIQQNALPCLKDPCPAFGPDVPAFYVLEVNANQAQALKMRTDERVDIRILK